MPKLSRSYAPFVYGVIQSGITTALSTAIATFGALGWSVAGIGPWLAAWALAWLMMLPLVIAISPLIQRAVNAVVEPPEMRTRSLDTAVEKLEANRQR
jgi:hypothetical protein